MKYPVKTIPALLVDQLNLSGLIEETKFLHLSRHLLYLFPHMDVSLSPKPPTPYSLQQRIIKCGNVDILGSAVHCSVYCKVFGEEPSQFPLDVENIC